MDFVVNTVLISLHVPFWPGCSVSDVVLYVLTRVMHYVTVQYISAYVSSDVILV